MSLHELNKIVNRAAKALHDGEKFPVGVLAVRARKLAEAYPNDSTVVGMSNFLTKRASSEPLISRIELRDVYHKLYSQNNQFGSIFAAELGNTELAKPKTMHHEASEGKDFANEAYSKLADPVLSNALSQVFDTNGTYQPYSSEIAKTAARVCLHELNKFAAPKKIDVVAGQSDLILCQADYETPRGWCSVLIPVEIKANAPLLPTVFLGKVGFADLTKNNLEKHIFDTVGKKFSVDVQKVLQAVASAKNGGIKPLSDIEMIIAKARAVKGSTYSINGITEQQVDQPNGNIETPRLPEADEFAKRLASTVGVAEFKFGKVAVDGGRKILRNALSGFGYSNANVAVASVDDSTIYFAVSVDNKAGFKVPMKTVDKNIQYPQVLLASGKIYDFSKAGISQALSAEVDSNMLAVASPSYGLKDSELIQQVHDAMLEGNLARAEDALAVLQRNAADSSTKMGTFKEALAIYQAGLGGKVKTAGQQSQCCKQRKIAHSKYMICGHTNLPTHKVYQDSNGDCQPLYRRNIPEAEGGSFLHSKVYFG